MLKHLLVFLGMVASLAWAGHRLYAGPTHYTHLSHVLHGTVYHRDHGLTPAAYLDTKAHVLLYFAASWCAACQQVTPLLRQFYTTYALHQNFEMLLVPADRSPEAMRAYVHRAALPWASVPFHDGQARHQLQAWYGSDTIPHLVLLDKRGRVLASSVHGGTYVGPLPVLAALRQRWQGRP
jgi:thiol-disulfide isomerase/thioredoxin